MSSLKDGRAEFDCSSPLRWRSHSGFNRAQFIVMAMGNIIGSGIFLASSLVMTTAGALTPLAYLLGGLIMVAEVAFIIEMSVAKPVHGAFKVYAQEVFGPWWGYTIGWVFWTSGVLGMASEVTACAIFMQLWFPAVPLWLFSLAFAVVITALNFNDLEGLSQAEFFLAFLKIATLFIFLLIGGAVLLGWPVGLAGTVPGLAAAGGVTPTASGLLSSMLLILFAYTGTGIIGMAVAETKEPAKTVPAAASFVTVSVVAMYSLAALLLVLLLPAQALDPNTSPFVAVFALFRIPYAADAVNLILVSAALSSLNSQVYSASRMLFALARGGQAPRLVARQNAQGVPVAAVWLSGLVLVAVSLLSYALPQRIFLYTVSTSGFLALVNWLSVSATHFFYRRKILAACPERLQYKVPGYPYLSWLCFAAILMILLSAWLYSEQRPVLYASLLILAFIGNSYLLLPRSARGSA